jgi:hypothetical protein
MPKNHGPSLLDLIAAAREIYGPREHYAALDQLAPGDRIWVDGQWRETATTETEDSGDISVWLVNYPGFTAPAALLVRRAER